MQAVLLVSVAASCQAGLLGAGHGEGSCAAAPFRTPVTALKWPAGCPGGAECCTEFGYCRPQAEWLAGAFRDCNGVSNGLPLSPETIAAENEAAAYGDPAAAALLVVPAAAAAPAVAVPAALHAAPAVAAVHAAPAVAAYNYAPAPAAQYAAAPAVAAVHAAPAAAYAAAPAVAHAAYAAHVAAPAAAYAAVPAVPAAPAHYGLVAHPNGGRYHRNIITSI